MFGGLLELIALLVVIVVAGFGIGYHFYRRRLGRSRLHVDRRVDRPGG